MSHPYHDIADRQRWSRAMAGKPVAGIDPASPPPFSIKAGDKIVTAGSCFAQHVARHLRMRGYPCFDTEPAHPLLSPAIAEAFNYGIYAARYGNIYSARQLLQLWRRATGALVPADDLWEDKKAWFDPFRPTIQPEGFTSLREYQADRRQHFAAVRRAFSEMDVFVFTLGLTECWASREDGAVYPLCPGVVAGRFDAKRHELLNLTVEEVVADLVAFVDEVRAVNPGMRLILTVSPVPLAATAQAQHVLAATTYSKAVLRVAAEQASRLPATYYFPAFEIVNAAGADYFANDRRSVTEQGVCHVMSLFFRHLLDGGDATPAAGEDDGFLQQSQAVVDAMCDEQWLDQPTVSNSATTDTRRMMHNRETADEVLAAASALMHERRHDDAIVRMIDYLRREPDERLERLLATCRYEAYRWQPPCSTLEAPEESVIADRFAGCVGVPEVAASELDATVLAAAIHHHGALLVRGLIAAPVARDLAAGTRQALDACAAWHDQGEGGFSSPWYARLPLHEGCEIAAARPWIESAGGVWAADSPRMLHRLTELFQASGVIDVIAGFFGERPMLSVGKSTLRCVPATIKHADWHQDGAFMGTDIRSLNVWLSLSDCGEDASGIELLPQRLSRVLPTGSHGALFDWSVGQGMVEQAAQGTATVSPVFAPGDALLFDHYFLHRTGVPAAIAKDRYAVESWFFAPSAYPAQQVPLKL